MALRTDGKVAFKVLEIESESEVVSIRWSENWVKKPGGAQN